MSRAEERAVPAGMAPGVRPGLIVKLRARQYPTSAPPNTKPPRVLLLNDQDSLRLNFLTVDQAVFLLESKHPTERAVDRTTKLMIIRLWGDFRIVIPAFLLVHHMRKVEGAVHAWVRVVRGHGATSKRARARDLRPEVTVILAALSLFALLDGSG